MPSPQSITHHARDNADKFLPIYVRFVFIVGSDSGRTHSAIKFSCSSAAFTVDSKSTVNREKMCNSRRVIGAYIPPGQSRLVSSFPTVGSVWASSRPPSASPSLLHEGREEITSGMRRARDAVGSLSNRCGNAGPRPTYAGCWRQPIAACDPEGAELKSTYSAGIQSFQKPSSISLIFKIYCTSTKT